MDERLVEMMSKIRAEARRAFGEEAAQRWMHSNWRVFDGRRPIDMAGREADMQRVLDYVAQLTGADDALKTAGIRDNEH